MNWILEHWPHWFGAGAVGAIDSGEVVLTLPTRALMDHALDTGVPDLPVKARWSLPPMAEGDTWSGSYTVGGEAAGYYRVMANAYTHGPDGGLFLFDDVLGEAWMYVSETGGRLTRFFEDSIFPEGVHPVAGPAAGWPTGPLARSPDYPHWHPDSVYLHMVYTVSESEGFKNAVEARVRGALKQEGRDRDLGVVTVPEDGIVSFGCPPKGWYLQGDAHAPDTDLVQGRDDIGAWAATGSHCGKLIQVRVIASDYLPWRLLNLAADTLQRHFGHTRGRIDWGLRFDGGRSNYNRWTDKITLAWRPASSRFRWAVAHEYGHALHEKALGGLFGLFRTPGCGEHYLDSISSYECALSEGFADYAGNVGSVTADYPDGYNGECFEHFGTPEAPAGRCQTVSHYRKPEIEGWVAALFTDLTDDTWDEDRDRTAYPGKYIAEVFNPDPARRPDFARFPAP